MSHLATPPSPPALHIESGIATITLNRPAQRNRLENEDLQTLLAHFQQVNDDPAVRLLVLTANTQGQPKPVFCAGYDIGGFGLHYYPSGLARYIQRMGLAATQRAFLTARPFTWQQLEKLGLFEDFVQATEWQATLNELTQDIISLAPLAAEETKKSINEIATGVAQEATLRERVDRTSLSEDFAEGRAAFAERRQPVFRGQ
ncbi:MAG: enoyl-CoA hydratase/isomerase family protein [Betaproteobacteria bacterium]|nr:enoyl-CoA hydratase/isomerase family protein [Betaproteobacteria bacterium]